MKDAIFLIFELLVAIARLLGPGGSRAIIAENLLLKPQLLVYRRARQRAPNLSVRDRVLFGFWALFLSPRRIARSAIIIKPSTLLRFHTALRNRKYKLLFSSHSGSKPGPKGPSMEVVNAVVEMKKRNPRFGCTRIAQQINLAFDLDLDKDIVRRILATHYRPDRSSKGSSWLTMLGYAEDSLWSVDLFRCESILLKSHWVMVVMDLCTRRVIGFAVHAGYVDGPTLCRMFIDATYGQSWPKYLSSDNDPLFQYHRWKANLRILEVEEIKSIPHVPMSHPFVERLIGSIRREFLDHTFFWTATDLENKLRDYQVYYNQHRTHSGRNGATPIDSVGGRVVDINQYRWEKHCRGLFELPIAA